MSDVRIDHNESPILILIKPLCLGLENSVRGQFRRSRLTSVSKEEKKDSDDRQCVSMCQSSQHADIKYLHKSFTH